MNRGFWYFILSVVVIANTILVGQEVEDKALLLNVVAVALAAFVMGVLAKEE